MAYHQPILIGALLLAPMVIPEAQKSAILIDAVDVPTVLADDGYSGDIVARRIKDQMRDIYERARPQYTLFTS